MRRSVFSRKRIIKDVQSRVGDFYSLRQIEEITEKVFESMIDAYKRGDIVDFGIGKTFLKLRKNNSNFSPTKSHTITFRGDVLWEVQSPLIDEALKDENLFNLLYSRRGSSETENL